jgi:hypothetical protein
MDEVHCFIEDWCWEDNTSWHHISLGYNPYRRPYFLAETIHPAGWKCSIYDSAEKAVFEDENSSFAYEITPLFLDYTIVVSCGDDLSKLRLPAFGQDFRLMITCGGNALWADYGIRPGIALSTSQWKDKAQP